VHESLHGSTKRTKRAGLTMSVVRATAARGEHETAQVHWGYFRGSERRGAGASRRRLLGCIQRSGNGSARSRALRGGIHGVERLARGHEQAIALGAAEAVAAVHHFPRHPFPSRWPEYLQRSHLQSFDDNYVAGNSDGDDDAPVSRQTRAWGAR
jgi:hypothetical protein